MKLMNSPQTAKMNSERVFLKNSEGTTASISSSDSPRISSSFVCSTSDECEYDTDTKLKTTVLRSSTVYYSVLAILILFIALAGLQLHLQSPNSSHVYLKESFKLSINVTEEAPCGSDANAARSAGCIFDPLTFAWLLPACYDWNLTSEFIALQDWEYFRLQPDGSRRQLSLINIMQSSDEIIYVSWEFHRQHCAYLWLKMHRAMLERRPIDGVSMLDIITDVCDGVTRSDRLGNDTSVPGYIRYPSCKLY